MPNMYVLHHTHMCMCGTHTYYVYLCTYTRFWGGGYYDHKNIAGFAGFQRFGIYALTSLSLINFYAVVIQRGWTVQEYCVCNRLCVMDEPSGPKPDNVTTSCFKMSVYHGKAVGDYSEERYFQGLRSWHISRSPLCRPAWLYEAPSHTVLEEALRTFLDLTEKVSTQDPKDLVRSLVPMLTNSPAETETDLMHLLQALDSLGQKNERIRQEIMAFKARTRQSIDLAMAAADGNDPYTKSHTVIDLSLSVIYREAGSEG